MGVSILTMNLIIVTVTLLRVTVSEESKKDEKDNLEPNIRGCKFQDETEYGKGPDGTNHTVCLDIVIMANDMKSADICTNTEQLVGQFLKKCGDNLTDDSNPKNTVYSALKCAIDNCDNSGFNDHLAWRQEKWKNQTVKCLAENNSSDDGIAKCLTDHKPLDCGKKLKECLTYDEKVTALMSVCEPNMTLESKVKECKERWATPVTLEDCFSELPCIGNGSKQLLEKQCLRNCYDETGSELGGCLKSCDKASAAAAQGGEEEGEGDLEAASPKKNYGPPKPQPSYGGRIVRANPKTNALIAAIFVVNGLFRFA